MNRTDTLLISNSTLFGCGYLDHVASAIAEILGSVRSVLFLPCALFDQEGYAEKAQARFAQLGFELTSIHRFADHERKDAVMTARSFFVGGGNTFRLLNALYRDRLLEPVRDRARAGVPYIGSSAGAIIAGPTIKTTKDMPIVLPPSLDALGIFPYQISPHYLDPDPKSRHMGETQEERILQFLEESPTPVIGLREGSWIRQREQDTVLQGQLEARVFRRGRPPVEVAPGTSLTALMGETT